jgi:hypothetical protein
MDALGAPSYGSVRLPKPREEPGPALVGLDPEVRGVCWLGNPAYLLLTSEALAPPSRKRNLTKGSPISRPRAVFITCALFGNPRIA